MNQEVIATLILFGVFLVCLLFRVPIMITLAVSAAATLFYMGGELLIIPQRMVSGVMSSSLVSIPFFIICGEIMGTGGISEELVAAANVFVGHFRGGLAQVNVLASMFFGGISGSAIADIASEGPIILPAMKAAGYDDEFSVAITVSSSIEGLVIPPSHNMIIYSTAAGGVSIAALYAGGIIPGILMGIAQMFVVAILSRRRNYPREARVGFKVGIKTLFKAIPAIMTIVIIMVGTLSGWFTATESAAFAALYAFIITFFGYRRIPLRAMKGILFNTLKTLSMVMAIIATASAFGYVMALLRIPTKLATLITGVTENRYLILLLIDIVLLLLGMIMDMAPLIIIMTPILLPVVTAVGVSPVHFGVIMMIALGIGLTTPPVGSALYMGCAVGKISIERATKGLIPFYIILVITLFVVTFIPEITLWLPGVMLGA